MGIVILGVELRYRHGEIIHLHIFKPGIRYVCCLATNVEISEMPHCSDKFEHDRPFPHTSMVS